VEGEARSKSTAVATRGAPWPWAMTGCYWQLADQAASASSRGPAVAGPLTGSAVTVAQIALAGCGRQPLAGPPQRHRWLPGSERGRP
jgi:hypothetical protein